MFRPATIFWRYAESQYPSDSEHAFFSDAVPDPHFTTGGSGLFIDTSLSRHGKWDRRYSGLDSVGVTGVPEPGSLFLAGAAIL